MIDSWILAFLVKGAIAASGYNMPLDQCVEQAGAMPSSNTQAVCINVVDPSCRIYVHDDAVTKQLTASCMRRLKRTSNEHRY